MVRLEYGKAQRTLIPWSETHTLNNVITAVLFALRILYKLINFHSSSWK